MNDIQSWRDWNFLAGEADIARRLKEATQQGPDAWCRIVATRDEMSQVKEDAQITPGLYVIYAGFTVHDATEHRARLNHKWRVLLAVGAAAPGRDASHRNQVAGRYLPCVLQALHGYVPAGCSTALKPATPPPAWASEARRFAYYPLVFEADCLYSTRLGPANTPYPAARQPAL